VTEFYTASVHGGFPSIGRRIYIVHHGGQLLASVCASPLGVLELCAPGGYLDEREKGTCCLESYGCFRGQSREITIRNFLALLFCKQRCRGLC